MVKKIILLLSLTAFVSGLSAKVIKGHVLVDGVKATAEYTVLADGTVGLGSGSNACISHYTKGRVTVPSKMDGYEVTQVMPLAFRFCNSIEVVIVQEGITRIGDFAFIGCSSVREVELPSTLKTVGSGAFIGLKKLEMMTCKAVTPPTWEYNDVCFVHKKGIGDDQLQHYRQGVLLNVPTESGTAYAAAKYSNSSIGWTTAEGWGTAFVNINRNALENFRLYDLADFYDVRRIASNPERYGTLKNLWLEADIDLPDTIFTTPLGETPELAFSGAIHGQGHTISNLQVNADGVSGFIGYYNGPSIVGLRLEKCLFAGTDALGAVAAVVTKPARIDSAFVNASCRGNGYVGGLVGEAKAALSIDRCWVEGNSLPNSQHPASDTELHAGLVGNAADATITNCAVIVNNYGNQNIAPFVAAGKATVSCSYADGDEYRNYTPKGNIQHSESVILTGKPLEILDYGGTKQTFDYQDVYFKTVYPAATLGIDAWAYHNGSYPIPDCFADRWDVHVNQAVYGSANLSARMMNVLTPDETIPASAWLDLSDQGFLPFTMTSDEMDEALGTQGAAEIHSMQYVSNAANEHTFAFTDHLNFINRSIKAGEPYLVLMKKGQLQIRAKDTEVIAAPREAEEEDVFEIDGYEIGWWKGTFAKLSNETSADINAYTLNSGKWCRIRSDGSNYRKAWVGAFRAYFKPKAPMAYNTYATYYIAEPQGDEDTEYNLFPADEYATEADFSGYEDDIDTGITLTTQPPSLNAETWFTLDGRRLNEVPTAPDIYVVGGKKVIIK